MCVRGLLISLLIAGLAAVGVVRGCGARAGSLGARRAGPMVQNEKPDKNGRRSAGSFTRDGAPAAEATGFAAAAAARRGAAVRTIIGLIESQSDYLTAVQELDATVPVTDYDGFALEVVRALLAEDPTWAANFALALPRGAARYGAIDIVAEEFARRDPRQALAWAQVLPPGATRSIALERIVGQMAEAGLAPSADVLAALEPGLAQDDAVSSLAAHWARRDPAGALDWARDFPDGPLKPRVLASIGFEFAQTDPAVALSLARTRLSPSDQALLRASVGLARAAAPEGAPSGDPEK